MEIQDRKFVKWPKRMKLALFEGTRASTIISIKTMDMTSLTVGL